MAGVEQKRGNGQVGEKKKGSSALVYGSVFLVIVGVAVQFICSQLDLPPGRLIRNIVSSPKPSAVEPRYSCGANEVSSLVTVVVTVKDACSQMPGFVASLWDVVGEDTALIITYPKFASCEPSSLGVNLKQWKNVQTLALPPHSSPMVGWLQAASMVTTPYSLLLHNDGYALDPFFACELLQALKTRNNESYVVAAPMLFESKADGSLAAHATQSRLRIVDGVVRHDHSIARALNRGFDYAEGEQTDFLEDHGFMIKSDAIAEIIDPSASYTLEYVDMILSLRSRGWKVVFVPTARLEFRIAEFSWRDIPYFMYKRSEATCHGTRDYLSAKWKAAFPNTGFWTYIKYTIVEDHTFEEKELTALPWRQQAALVLGFFQMAGYNRYIIQDNGEPREYVYLLEDLDAQDLKELGHVTASRQVLRPIPTEVRNATPAENLLPLKTKSSWIPSVEADMPLEYMPFAVAKLSFSDQSCSTVLHDTASEKHFPIHLCGIALSHPSGGCDCWINLPTFKSHSSFVDTLASVASLLKVPSRVTTYLEMALGSANPASDHVAKLTQLKLPQEKISLQVATCGGAQTQKHSLTEACDSISFDFNTDSNLVYFSGRPAAPWEVFDAISALISTAEEQ